MANITMIEINGRRYEEADHGRFEAALLDDGVMIAVTSGDRVLMYSGNFDDVKTWADSYDIETVEQA